VGTIDKLRALRHRTERRGPDRYDWRDLLDILIEERDAGHAYVEAPAAPAGSTPAPTGSKPVLDGVLEDDAPPPPKPNCRCDHTFAEHTGISAYATPACRHPNCPCTHYELPMQFG